MGDLGWCMVYKRNLDGTILVRVGLVFTFKSSSLTGVFLLLFLFFGGTLVVVPKSSASLAKSSGTSSEVPDLRGSV